jgi:hypothetical protein
MMLEARSAGSLPARAGHQPVPVRRWQQRGGEEERERAALCCAKLAMPGMQSKLACRQLQFFRAADSYPKPSMSAGVVSNVLSDDHCLPDYSMSNSKQQQHVSRCLRSCC